MNDALVLVVDDHTDTREGYEAYLKFVGARVVTAASGEEAITIARKLRPDAIVMDMKLDGMPGAEAARVLKSDTVTSGIPIIGLSGRQEDGTRCDVFLMKPCMPDQLARVLREVMPRPRTPRPEALPEEL